MMATLDRIGTTLRIFGDQLVPDEVTSLLGCGPTDAWTKGDIKKSKSKQQIIRSSGAWHLSLPITPGVTFNEQVAELLGMLTNDLSAWRVINQRYKVDLFCGWFMSTGNDRVSIGVNILKGLADRGIEVSLDIYEADES